MKGFFMKMKCIYIVSKYTKRTMKTFKSNLLGLALAGLILGACSQTGMYETADLMNEQAEASKSGFRLDPFGMGNENARVYATTDCQNFCIDPENPEYSVQTATITNNNGPQIRVFTYAVYNTLTGFQLDWNYASSNRAGRKLKITVSGAGFASPKSYTSAQLNGGPGSGSNTFAFDAVWAACGVVTVVAEILDGDDDVLATNTTQYGLIGACIVSCEESFSYVQNQDGSYTFTYRSEVDLDDAEVKFTSPHVTEITSEDGKIYTVNPGNGKGSPTVSTWVGDITACTPITFTLSFTPDCDQNQGGFANIWTDFKVNEVSKKDISEPTDTIKFECEE